MNHTVDYAFGSTSCGSPLIFRNLSRLRVIKMARTAISFSCWSIWIGANAATAVYAWLNLRDVPLAVVSAFNGICCGAVLTLALYKRAAARVRRSGSPSLAAHTTGLIEGRQHRSEIEPKM
jgi:hypothetical protein